jgi:hypothetical protein
MGRQTYRLEATLDYTAATLAVTETLDWTNLSPKPVNSIDLSVIPAHVGAFQLADEVSVDGIPAAADFFAYDTNLRIMFPTPVHEGATAHIVIPFNLHVGSNPGALGGRLSNMRGVLQFGEWFPVWSTVHGFSEIGEPQLTWNAESIVLELSSTTELGVDAVASSGARRGKPSGDHWVFEAHNVRDFAFAVNPDYRVSTATTECDGVEIELRAYASRASEASLARHALDALRAYNAWFGCYAYPSLSVAEVGSPYFSMEFPTLVFIGHRATDDLNVIHHEVAHQWWYGMVGNDQMMEPWLDESFAEFSAHLLGADIKHCSTREVGNTIYNFGSWSDCEEYLDTVYGRGAAFLAAMRERLGDDQFFEALREIVSTYRYGVATTAGVVGIFRDHSAEPIDDLLIEYGIRASGEPRSAEDKPAMAPISARLASGSDFSPP